MAEKHLLGKLHTDKKYLQGLINNPLLRKVYRTPGDDYVPDITQLRIIQAAEEGLAYLESRKSFWQQQEPVFARKMRR